MIDVSIMIEGQDGLTWPRWQALARAVEELGFNGLFRSDHFTNASPPDKDSLELWSSLTWLAGATRRIRFGPLVTPFSFRHPAHTARMAAAVDDLSGGRLVLGLGAGWQQREHRLYGFDLLPPKARFDRLVEGVQVVHHWLTNSQPLDFDGRYYQLHEATLLPRPARPGGPPILIGGNGMQRTLPLAARFAGEWNGVFLTPLEFDRRSRLLNALLEQAGRAPAAVRRSMMTNLVFAASDAALAAALSARGRTAEELRANGGVIGTASAVVDQLGRLAEAGVQEVMLQWLEQDNLDGLAALADAVLPQVRN